MMTVTTSEQAIAWLTAERDAAIAEGDALATIRARLVRERDAAVRERDEAIREGDELNVSTGDLRDEIGLRCRQRDAALAEVDRLTAELDAIDAQVRAAVDADDETPHSTLAMVEVLWEERDAAVAEAAELASIRTRIADERDALRTRLALADALAEAVAAYIDAIDGGDVLPHPETAKRWRALGEALAAYRAGSGT